MTLQRRRARQMTAAVVAFAFVAFALVVGVVFGIVERGDEDGLGGVPIGLSSRISLIVCRF